MHDIFLVFDRLIGLIDWV